MVINLYQSILIGIHMSTMIGFPRPGVSSIYHMLGYVINAYVHIPMDPHIYPHGYIYIYRYVCVYLL